MRLIRSSVTWVQARREKGAANSATQGGGRCDVARMVGGGGWGAALTVHERHVQRLDCVLWELREHTTRAGSEREKRGREGRRG